MTNTAVAVQLSTLNREITALTNRLLPVHRDAVLRSLEVMQSAGMTIPKGIDPSKLDTVYGYALEGVPACGLTIATQKLIKGDYAGNPDLLLGVIPKPPVLAALAKLEAKPTREDLVRKRDLEQTMTHRPDEIDRSPEVMARVRRLIGDHKAATAARHLKERGIVAHDEMTAEKAEYFAAIMNLKDAPDISAEQAAFRRKVSADLDAVKPEETERGAA